MMAMSPVAFRAEVARRIALNEGTELRSYRDSLGIWTIGCGFNLERADAPAVLRSCGVPMTFRPGWESSFTISESECHALLERELLRLEPAARDSLAPGVYDRLCDARRFVLCDLVYNLGAEGWSEFVGTRAKINAGAFADAGAHLRSSAWFEQVGARAERDVAMMTSGAWVPQ